MIEKEELMHYGVGHLHGGHSGRYPFGSGKNGKQRAKQEKKAKKYAEKYAKITGGKLKVKTNNNQPKNEKQRPNARVLDKPISAMSDEEIRSRIGRIRLENELASYINPNTKPSNLPKDKKEKFRRDTENRLKSIKDQVVWPSVYDAGRTTLTKWLKDKGKELLDRKGPPDPYKELKDLQYDMALRGKIAKDYKTINDQGLNDILLSDDRFRAFKGVKSKKDKQAIEKHIEREAKKAEQKVAKDIVKSGAKLSKNITKKSTPSMVSSIMSSVGSQTVSSVMASRRYTSSKNSTYSAIKALSKKRKLTSSLLNDRSDLFSTIQSNSHNAEIVKNAMKSYSKKYGNFTPLRTNYKIKGFKTL